MVLRRNMLPGIPWLSTPPSLLPWKLETIQAFCSRRQESGPKSDAFSSPDYPTSPRVLIMWLVQIEWGVCSPLWCSFWSSYEFHFQYWNFTQTRVWTLDSDKEAVCVLIIGGSPLLSKSSLKTWLIWKIFWSSNFDVSYHWDVTQNMHTGTKVCGAIMDACSSTNNIR